MLEIDKLWEQAWDTESSLRGYDKIAKEDFRQSSRTSRANPDGENYDWWYFNGKTFLERWVEWREGSNWELWTTPDGTPAIELDLQIQTGGITLKGAIDRVFVTSDNQLIIVDLKTGLRTPSSDLQLQVYACMMEREFGIRPHWGAYWMARQGTTSEPVALDRFTLKKLDELVALFEKARQNNLYLPNFDSCKLCSYTEHCYWVDGQSAIQLGEVNVI
jgi:RecB family exonuclease